MPLSSRARKLVAELSDQPKLGDIKKLGKEIKKDHDLAGELWATGEYYPRLLSTLIFDNKLLTEQDIEVLASDLLAHDEKERNQLSDWLLANQLTKSKKIVPLMETWQDHPSRVMRRWFWYHQARLRWTGRTPPPENSSELLDSLEADMPSAEPEVQWVMNFCAGWIGVYEPKLRARCVKLGKKLGLYKDDPVSKNCTPSYLPEFIRIEVAKRE
ncbi:DNA alkylation repair protein [Thalassoglobus sp. JC818]|uniref:DNA alkylation repair protein n=1 Tax=Thalassoglobus sp. JC818 TaxID=3232136 RepID=UPI003458E66E